MPKITEIQIVPVKPNNGLVAFASVIYDGSFYLGSIAIFTRKSGGYRLVFPNKVTEQKSIDIFYPISKDIGKMLEEVISKKFEEVMNNDRYNSYKYS